MPAKRLVPSILLAVAALAAAPAPVLAEETAPEPAEKPEKGEKPEKLKEEVRREVLDEVRRELDKARQEIRDEVAYVEGTEDARNYDAKALKELKQAVNLLQLHGYFRLRGDLFNRADLGRGADASGNTLFPTGTSDYLGAANMRLRLNPVLRISDDLAIYAQFDVLDNVVAGENPFIEPFFDATTGSRLLSSRITGQAIQVKRLWAEVETPIGQLSFGRKGLHWGEGLFYNDGNCLDCDYGNTFDRLQLTAGPFLHHLVTIAVDSLSEGVTSQNDPTLALYGQWGVPRDLQQLDDALRFSIAVQRTLAPQELRRRVDDGEWVVNYGALVAYRTQHSTTPALEQAGAGATTPAAGIVKIDAHLVEIDVYAQVLHRKLRLATEWAGVTGSFADIPGMTATGASLLGQPLDLLQGAGVVRGQYSLLKQDSLLVGVDVGLASGDKAPGMGARPGRKGSAADGSAARGDIDGRQFCTTACSDRDVTNFRINPDFRIDQLLWRNLFTTITDAWFARGEVRFKPGGRASGGGDDDGFELSGALVYSQAIFASSTPNGTSPLGLELDASVTYTSKDRFFAALVAGFLLPFDGLNNPLLADDAGSAKLGQVYRGVLGVSF